MFLIAHLIYFYLMLTSFSVLSKSMFVTNLAMSLLLAKFACFDLAAKFSDVNLLTSGVVIYLLLSS